MIAGVGEQGERDQQEACGGDGRTDAARYAGGDGAGWLERRTIVGFLPILILETFCLAKI